MPHHIDFFSLAVWKNGRERICLSEKSHVLSIFNIISNKKKMLLTLSFSKIYETFWPHHIDFYSLAVFKISKEGNQQNVVILK